MAPSWASWAAQLTGHSGPFVTHLQTNACAKLPEPQAPLHRLIKVALCPQLIKAGQGLGRDVLHPARA